MHRILFLGTGGDTIVVGKQIRSSGGIVLNIEDEQFHINPGPGSLLMARMHNINIRETTALFLSGNDLIKANDANAMISAMTHDGLDKKGVLVCPSNLIEKKNDETPFIHKFYFNCVEKVIITDNTKKLGINKVEIEVIDLPNSVVGYKFIASRYRLSYLPDTEYKNDYLDRLKDTDILILNVQDPRDIKRKEHLNSQDVENIISKIKPQITIITGFGIKMIQADPLYEAREIQRNTSVNVVSAKDGMLINPLSFTTTIRQSSLKSF